MQLGRNVCCFELVVITKLLEQSEEIYVLIIDLFLFYLDTQDWCTYLCCTCLLLLRLKVCVYIYIRDGV